MLQARAKRLPDVACCLLSAGIFRASRPLYDVLAIGALAMSAACYDGLEEALLVGFTSAECTTLTQVFEDLLTSPEREETVAAYLSRLSPALRVLHERCARGEEPLLALPPEQPVCEQEAKAPRAQLQGVRTRRIRR